MKLLSLHARRFGFTLIELLVVISIIGILAALAIPAVSGALVKGQMTGTLNNARQLQLANFNLNLERETIGQPGAWPGSSNTVATDFGSWVNELTNALPIADLRKMFSAPRVSVTNLPTSADQTAFFVYRVGDIEESSAVYLTTRNWDATTPNTKPASTAIPYGDKGVIVMRKGGDGQVFQVRFLDTNSVGLLTNQPAKL